MPAIQQRISVTTWSENVAYYVPGTRNEFSRMLCGRTCWNYEALLILQQVSERYGA
jgi:hypothetical protein